MNYVNGSNLQAGRRYRLIASGTGVIVNNNTVYLASDVVDKKDNRTLVDVGSGTSVAASPTSIWSEV